MIPYLFFSVVLLSCKKNTEQSSKPQFWKEFQTNLEDQRLVNLTTMMTDSIYCSICSEETYQYGADQMADNYREQLLEPNHRDFTMFVDSSIYSPTTIYHLIFEIDCNQCPDGAYNVIYDFTEEKESVKLTQIFSVP